MSSGINWMYTVSNANPEEPPIKYAVGQAWASGERDRLIVGMVSGLHAVRTAYAQLPGLDGSANGGRDLWVSAVLSGAPLIVEVAGKELLGVFAHRQGKRSPLYGGSNPEKQTVAEFFDGYNFVCGREIAAHASVALDAPFLENWQALALAADEWPKQRWGANITRVTTLKVETRGLGTNRRECGRDETARVLDAAAAWAAAIDPMANKNRADAEIAHLLDDEVVRAAIAVTKGKGSVAGLRHALTVSGHLPRPTSA